MPSSCQVQLDSSGLASPSASVPYLGFANDCPLLMSYTSVLSLVQKPENLTSRTQYLAAAFPN